MSGSLPRPPSYFADHLADLQARIRARVGQALRGTESAVLAEATEPPEGDTVFALDARVDDVVYDFFAGWGEEMPLVLIAEGIAGDGWKVFPEGASAAAASLCCIVDPIDGTRGLMYQKRSGWVLSAIAPLHGRMPRLSDITVAMQTELPTARSHLSDILWTEGGTLQAETHNLADGTTRPFRPRPSSACDLSYGFASVSKFLPLHKALTARFEERLLARVGAESHVFDDQYISSGGQLYELMCGHDRFVADLRPVFEDLTGRRGLCAHPYDLCTEAIARVAGVRVTGPAGEQLDAPLDIRARVAWLGYANRALQERLQPEVLGTLAELAG